MRALIDGIDLSMDSYVEEAFPEIKHGMCEFCLSNGSFSVIDVIDYLLETVKNADVCISTWVASYASIRHIVDFLEDNRANNFRFLMDKGLKRTRGELYDYIQKTWPGSIGLISNHSKFIIVQNDKYNFVVETSANLNKNNRLENFRITENKEYAEFFRGAFDKIFDACKENGGTADINKIYG